MIDWQVLLGQVFTAVISAVITILVPVLAVMFFRLIAQGLAWLKQKVGDRNYEILQSLLVTAVNAAEQSGLKKLIEDEGTAKKAYALAYLQAALNARGIKIPVVQLEAEIEAALHEGWHQFNEDVDPPPEVTEAVNIPERG